MQLGHLPASDFQFRYQFGSVLFEQSHFLTKQE
jgi:hypothetical protein